MHAAAAALVSVRGAALFVVEARGGGEDGREGEREGVGGGGSEAERQRRGTGLRIESSLVCRDE